MGAFTGLWPFAQTLSVVDTQSPEGRFFRGFLEPLGLAAAEPAFRSPVGEVSKERFRLIAEPGEAFAGGTESVILFEGFRYALLGLREIYAGEGLSHREAVLCRIGEVAADA